MDRIWNRAATQQGGAEPRSGDRALSAVLQLHSLAMSGGLLDAAERLSNEQLDAAEAGYRWLGISPAADLVARLRSAIQAGALDDDDRAESLEMTADEEYSRLIPTDDTLVAAFHRRRSEEPDSFAAP